VARNSRSFTAAKPSLPQVVVGDGVLEIPVTINLDGEKLGEAQCRFLLRKRRSGNLGFG
jgi:hypothetical protein